MLPASTAAPTAFAICLLSPVITESSVCELTFHDQAVDRDPFARPDPDQHPGTHLAHRPAMLLHAFDHRRRFAFRGQQRREIARRPGASCRLEIAAKREQHQHHRGGIEIKLAARLNTASVE